MQPCPDCGARGWKRFADETFEVSHAGRRERVAGLSGHRCDACGEVLFDPAGAERYAAAGDALVLAERRRIGEELRRIRRKLGLTQAQAAALTGGGHNAFSRYEKGLVPVAAVLNLFRLLDRHPDLLRELDANDNEPPPRAVRRA